MASEMRLASRLSAVYYSGAGRVTGAEVLAAARSLRSLASASSISFILVDLSSTTSLDITTSQVRDLAAISLEAARFCAAAKFAVSAPPAHVYGLARMWDVLMEGSPWEIRIFRERDSALAWLGLPEHPEDNVAVDLSA